MYFRTSLTLVIKHHKVPWETHLDLGVESTLDDREDAVFPADINLTNGKKKQANGASRKLALYFEVVVYIDKKTLQETWHLS